MSYALFDRDYIGTQVDARVSPFGHVIQVNESSVTSIIFSLRQWNTGYAVLNVVFCDLRILARKREIHLNTQCKFLLKQVQLVVASDCLRVRLARALIITWSCWLLSMPSDPVVSSPVCVCLTKLPAGCCMMYVCPAGAWMIYDGVPWTAEGLWNMSCVVSALTCTTSNLLWLVLREDVSSSLVTVPSLLTAIKSYELIIC